MCNLAKHPAPAPVCDDEQTVGDLTHYCVEDKGHTAVHRCWCTITWINVTRSHTPWAVLCEEHGQVFLTEQEYIRQMSNPDARWYCPLCLTVADWDDDNYEDSLS